MNDDQRAVDFLAESVKHSISTVEKGVEAYVFHGDESAYGTVVTQLRKLLVDKNAVASFRKSVGRANWAACLLELHYGSGKNILLKSFRQAHKPTFDDYVDVTPDIYSKREDILRAATQGGNLVPLYEWLDEGLAYSKNGEVLRVGAAIKYIAGHEGSHIINPVGDIREDVAIAFTRVEPTSDNISDIDFNSTNHWRQFVIDAGMRLLAAQTRSGARLIEHSIHIPNAPEPHSTMRVQKKRPT